MTSSSASTARKPWSFLLWLWPLVACFFVAVWHMRYDWTYDASYSYGWFVLPLAIYLFSVRWRDRPEPEQKESSPPLWPWLVLAVLLIFGWQVREANPEWRILSILFSCIAMAASLLLLQARGGSAWRHHFLGAVLFFAVAIPWPSELEKMVTGALMPINAAVSEECLLWGNVAATRQGNLISIANGTLGVEEACSGIRSLQATIMMAWFLGELYSIAWGKRLFIFLSGLAAALFTNIVRTIVLSMLAAKNGMASASINHDKAGFTALAVNVIIMLLLTRKMVQSTLPPPTPASKAKSAFPGNPIPLLGPILLGSAALLLYPVTELWYGGRETASTPPWHLVPPQKEKSFLPLPIADRTKIMLRYNQGWSARWLHPTNKRMQGFFFDWDRGRVPPENFNVHTPGGCLAAIGIKMVHEAAPISYKAGGVEHQARFMRFQDGDRPLYVLFSVSGKTAVPQAAEYGFDFSYTNRWFSVLHGTRNPGQRLIEIGLWDEPDEAKARAVFEEILSQQIAEGDLASNL